MGRGAGPKYSELGVLGVIKKKRKMKFRIGVRGRGGVRSKISSRLRGGGWKQFRIWRKGVGPCS